MSRALNVAENEDITDELASNRYPSRLKAPVGVAENVVNIWQLPGLGSLAEDNTPLSEDNTPLAEENTPFSSEKSILLSGKNKEMAGRKSYRTYPCDQCKYVGNRRSNLQQHKEIKHFGIKFCCDICDYKANRKQNLDNHARVVHAGIKYPCNECNYEATEAGNLKKHFESKHAGVRYACDACDKSFTRIESLKRHQKNTHMKNNKVAVKVKEELNTSSNQDIVDEPSSTLKNNNTDTDILSNEGFRYSCDHCEFSAVSLRSIRDHVNVKHFCLKYSCDLCSYQASRNKTLTRHKQVVHLGVRYPCDECSYVATDSQNLRTHKRSLHLGIRYSCDECGKDFTRSQSLSRHKRTQHPPSYPEEGLHDEYVVVDLPLPAVDANDCNQIVKEEIYEVEADFNTPHYYEPPVENSDTGGLNIQIDPSGHFNNHQDYSDQRIDLNSADDKPYQPVNPMFLENGYKDDFNNQLDLPKLVNNHNTDVNQLDQHKENNHHTDGFPCIDCGFIAVSRRYLNHHKIREHKEVQYQCAECDYVASCAQNLRRHGESKHEGITYPCDQCDFASTQRGNLRKHIAIRHEGVRYKCDQCEFSSTRSNTLKHHKAKKH